MREDNDKLNGIIFRLYDSKPGDRVVHLLASDGSRHVLIAKGVKKGTSRKAHAIDLLNYVQVKVSGKGDMPLITDIKLIDKFEGFKSSYKGLIFVQLICEVLHIFILEKQEEVGYFRNLLNLLEATSSKLDLLAAAFILRMLNLSGDLPKLNEDVHTGDEMLPEEGRYLNVEIGYTRNVELSSGEVSDRLFKAQRFILRNDFATILRLDLSEEEQCRLLEIHIDWLQKVTEREIKSYLLFK